MAFGVTVNASALFSLNTWQVALLPVLVKWPMPEKAIKASANKIKTLKILIQTPQHLTYYLPMPSLLTVSLSFQVQW